jgi:hypothetical protein
MKTQIQNTRQNNSLRGINKLLLTGGMLIGLTVGWCIGSLSTDAFSQSTKQKYNSSGLLFLPSISMGGETLPTIILPEFSITSNSK